MNIDKRKILFARWLMLKAVIMIVNVAGRAGNGSFTVRSFIFHEIDTCLEFRAYKQQGYKVRIK